MYITVVIKGATIRYLGGGVFGLVIFIYFPSEIDSFIFSTQSQAGNTDTRVFT